MHSSEFDLLDTNLESLLFEGGDSRMHPLPETGLNKYGCATWCREAVPFGSCTASSISPRGQSGARESLARLRAASRENGVDGIRDGAESLFEEYRQRLREVMQIEGDVDIAFCPSGTDAEFLALAVARRGDPRPILNIVSGPSEVGSGTMPAAIGHHFNERVPVAESRTPKTPIDETLSADVEVATIVLRHADGPLREQDAIDARATELVEGAVAEGRRVLLHVVTHSKTGAYAPSFDCVAALKETHGDDLTVVLDAAQARLSRRSIGLALGLDYLVLITGSKFYGGPPFSGALLVPRQLALDAADDTLSVGFRDYMTAPEMPRSWKAAREVLPALPNTGLVLRWGAALAEIEAYYATPFETRRRILQEWVESVPALLGISEMIEVAPVEPIRTSDSPRLLEAHTTVFPFFVRNPDGGFYEKKVLKGLFARLNRDLSATRPGATAAEKAVLARRLHIGQPVRLGGPDSDNRAVLRVALGAPLVTRLASDQRLGKSFDERLQWLRAQLEILRSKIELLVAPRS